MQSNVAALGAVVLWASLASLGTLLDHLPPLFLTGVGLLVGSLISLPLAKFQLRVFIVPRGVLLLGVYGLFGYHVALFMAIQNAPAVQANLVNYLWPLLIVVLAPIFIPSARLRFQHVLSALAGFAGATLAILSGAQLTGGFEVGYLWGLIAAIAWSTYSLGTKRIGKFPTAAVGLFGFVAGSLSLLAHLLFEPAAALTGADWVWLLILGLGPLGASFYLWDYALKNGDAQRVGLIAFLTPLLSTVLLLIVTGSPLTPLLLLSAALIFGGAFYGGRVNN